MEYEIVGLGPKLQQIYSLDKEDNLESVLDHYKPKHIWKGP